MSQFFILWSIKSIIKHIEDINPSQSLPDKQKPLQKERPDAETKIVSLEPASEKGNNTRPVPDILAKKEIQPLQETVNKPLRQAPPVKSDLDPVAETPQASGMEIASLGQLAEEDDPRGH